MDHPTYHENVIKLKWKIIWTINEKSKDYCKAERSNVFCFSITIFPTSFGWPYQPLSRQAGYPTYLGSPPPCKQALSPMNRKTHLYRLSINQSSKYDGSKTNVWVLFFFILFNCTLLTMMTEKTRVKRKKKKYKRITTTRGWDSCENFSCPVFRLYFLDRDRLVENVFTRWRCVVHSV